MTAAYGSSWRDRRAKIDNSNAPSSHKMPPFLRLNSTGESPSIDERPANSILQQRTPLTSDRRGLIGKIASHLIPQTNAPGARQFIDIHTAVGGIAALDEHIFSGEAKTMASYVRGTPPVDRQATMSKPVARPNPSHVWPSRYGQWTVDGLSPYMQPGVFPCNVFSAMQVGSSFGQISNVWSGQSKLLASVSDSVLNCQVGQNFPFQTQVPFTASQGRGRGLVYNNHSCDSKPSSSQPCSPSQKKAGSTDSGHCVNTARHQNGGHHCVCEKESSVDMQSKILHCNSLHGSPCRYRDSNVKADPNDALSTSVQPCKVSVSSNSDSVVSKAVDICSCDNKEVDNASKDKPYIPDSCDSASPLSSKMSSILQLVFERKHIAECEPNMSLTSGTPLIMSTLTGAWPHAAELHSKTSINHSYKAGSVDDSCEMSSSSEMSDSRNGKLFLESDNSAEDLHPTFSSSPKKSNSAVSDTVDVAVHATTGSTDADVDDDKDDISFRSESDTAASASSASCSDTQQNTLCSGAQENISISEPDLRQTSNSGPDRDLDHCLFEADELETDCVNDDEVDWNDWSDDETENAFTPKDSDFFDLHIPVLSSFLPGQTSHPCPAFSGASCAVLTDIGQVAEVEVLFCPNDEDAPDGACGRIFNNDGTVRTWLSKDANDRWDQHYSTDVPNEKTNTKVRFQCGKGVDRCHEFERVEVEHRGDEDTSQMTCMERQKLMDEQRRQGQIGHSADHDEDEDI